MAESSCPLRCCSCSARCGQRRRSARTTSRPAAPAPITRSDLGLAWVFAFEKSERGFQGFDGNPFGARSAHGSHIQAEPVEVECRAVEKFQTVLVGVKPGDFCFHEGHPGPLTELTQVDGEVVVLIEASNQPWHHAGIKRCAAPVDQRDVLGWASLWSHGPAFEQKRMAVASSGQQQCPAWCHVDCR